jgi:ubiquinone/menaquinone biosynthesis C-methylase UbiE
LNDKEELVRKGYDTLSEKFQKNRTSFDIGKEFEAFRTLLPKNAKVLDLGCGTGVSRTKFLVDSGFNVTGIDFSEKMLKYARKNVPEAIFIQQDMTTIDFQENTFDGLIACYSIIHVPREKHALLFKTIHTLLKPGGVMLISLGSKEWEGTDNFLGTNMFWSHYSPQKSLQIIKDAGFQIIFDRMIVGGGEKHYWILAKKGNNDLSNRFFQIYIELREDFEKQIDLDFNFSEITYAISILFWFNARIDPFSFF